MKKLTYAEFCDKMREHNSTVEGRKNPIIGVIVFTKGSFYMPHSLDARSYRVSSCNKAWIPGMSGYSIFGSSLDGSDLRVRLEQYMRDERGGISGWRVDYCYFPEDGEL